MWSMSIDIAWRKKNSGEPGNGGHFGQRDRPEADTFLGDAATAIDLSFPEPQANDLDKVSAVVDAVAAGANTAEAIAESMSMVDREGSYYGDAAGYLGLVQTVSGGDIKTYELTPAGEQMLEADPNERLTMLRDITAQAPGMQMLDEYGTDGVGEYLEAAGLGEATATRRTATLVSWSRSLAQPEDFANDIALSVGTTRLRSAAAAEHAEEGRAARASAAAASMPKPAAICTSCFMALPVSGICDC
jgi:hypothetical protein